MSGVALVWYTDAEVVYMPTSPELERHIKAFQVWFNGGNPLTYPEVAEKTGWSVNTIKKWAKAYGWQSRKEALLEEASRNAEEAQVQSLTDAIEEMLGVVDLGFEKLITAIEDKKIRWSGADIKRLAEAKMLLLGAPTERIENVGEDTNDLAEAILNDPEAAKLATQLFERTRRRGVGEADASGSSAPSE